MVATAPPVAASLLRIGAALCEGRANNDIVDMNGYGMTRDVSAKRQGLQKTLQGPSTGYRDWSDGICCCTTAAKV